MDCGFYLEDIALGTGTEEVTGLAAHLAACASCSELSREFSAIQTGLLNSARPAIPSSLITSVKRSIRTELSASTDVGVPTESLLTSLTRQWLLPYSVASVTSVIVIGSLLWLMISGTGLTIGGIVSVPAENDSRDVVMIDRPDNIEALNRSKVSAKELATSRSDVSAFSPSVNPDGALMALAGTVAQRKIPGGELVVVANVLSDGSADLEEIVGPLEDERIIVELEQAMSGKGADAPFVPAYVDNRPEQTRVVFKLQRVDIKVSARGSR